MLLKRRVSNIFAQPLMMLSPAASLGVLGIARLKFVQESCCQLLVDKIVGVAFLLTPERKRKKLIEETVNSPSGRFEVDLDISLFDAEVDEDTQASTLEAESRLIADGLLYAHSP